MLEVRDILGWLPPLHATTTDYNCHPPAHPQRAQIQCSFLCVLAYWIGSTWAIKAVLRWKNFVSCKEHSRRRSRGHLWTQWWSRFAFVYPCTDCGLRNAPTLVPMCMCKFDIESPNPHRAYHNCPPRCTEKVMNMSAQWQVSVNIVQVSDRNMTRSITSPPGLTSSGIP